MKKLLFVISLLLTLGQAAWAQNTQTITWDDNTPTDIDINLDENIDAVQITAYVHDYHQIGIFASSACFIYVDIPEQYMVGDWSTHWPYNGGTTAWNSYNGTFGYWVYAKEITFELNGRQDSPVGFNITLQIHYADRIASEEILGEFINHAESNVRNNLGLGADITLNDRLKIGIYDDIPVGINLHGHTLQRNLSSSNADGHVVEVLENDNLTLSNGTLAGGYADYGGGICNYGTLTLNDVTITNCQATKGGAIMNYGTAYINGGTLSGNTASSDGGAIWNAGTLTIDGGSITDNTALIDGGGIMGIGTLNIKGDLQVKDNIPDDILLDEGQTINIVGAITCYDNSIGVNMVKPGVLTNGFGNSGTTGVPFFAFGPSGITVDNGECKWVHGYYECSWDETTQTVIHTPKLLTEPYHNLCDQDFINTLYSQASDTHGSLPAGWYIVEGNINLGDKYLECSPEGNGEVHIILCDRSSLTLNHINVVRPDNQAHRSLHIYSQSYGSNMGILCAINTKNKYAAAIGGLYAYIFGDIYIHGGLVRGEVDFEAHGSLEGGAAGIGCGQGDRSGGGTIKIYDGTIYAKGGERGAGIGGGHTTEIDTITIYGGNITAIGGQGGAGIGTGTTARIFAIDVYSDFIYIYGGTINATGGHGNSNYGISPGAGIGIGGDTDAHNKIGRFNIIINGGKVTAQGGSGDDGSWGNDDQHAAAGIGTGGDCSNMNPKSVPITINGGEVYAYGGAFEGKTNFDGAGIGGGYSSSGFQVVITGGKVTAVAGNSAASAIGAGDNNNDNGTLTLPDNYSVKAGANSGSATLSPANDRVNNCHNNLYTLIEPCDHQGTLTGQTCSWCASVIAQALTLSAGWNWWAPVAKIPATLLHTTLGTNLLQLKTKQGNDAEGDLEPGQMFKLQTQSDVSETMVFGTSATPTINIDEDTNWIGYTGESTDNIAVGINRLYGNSFQPRSGDKIVSQDGGFLIYQNGEWTGTLTQLIQGQGYIYVRAQAQ